MWGYVWDLSGTDRQCDSYAPGHQIHWIHFNHSMREPSVVIPVTAVVDDDGLVHIEGDDLSHVRWNHRPALLRAALERFGGRADWKPRWYLLAVPTEAFMGSARSVFSLAVPGERSECHVIRTTNPDHLVPHPPAPTNMPPLRIAARYAAGRPRAQRRAKPCGARGDVEIERNGEDSSPIDVRQAQCRGTGGNDSS
jgi:hypothetical protein